MTHCKKTALGVQRKVLTASLAGTALPTLERVGLLAHTGARISSEMNPAVQEY